MTTAKSIGWWGRTWTSRTGSAQEESLRVREAQLLAAAEIQRQLLPQQSPVVPGLDIAGRCYAAEFAAGDHFDYLWLPDGSLVVALADVSGHGVGPAMVTASLHARFHSLAELSSDLLQIVKTLNARLHQQTAGEMFITMIAARIDPQSRMLTCVNAGHPSGYVLDAAGEVKGELKSTSLPLAVLPSAEFTVRGPVALVENDLLFFLHRRAVRGASRKIADVRDGANPAGPPRQSREASVRDHRRPVRCRS